jgi:hypothetical protein
MDNIYASVEGAKGLLGANESINQIFPWLDSQWMDTVMTNTEQGWTSAFSSLVDSLTSSAGDYSTTISGLEGTLTTATNNLITVINDDLLEA